MSNKVHDRTYTDNDRLNATLWWGRIKPIVMICNMSVEYLAFVEVVSQLSEKLIPGTGSKPEQRELTSLLQLHQRLPALI